ncbi:MAG TPA: Fe-S cluster assembly protein SufD, partial [Methylococcaceae bacterium]|nr:Fe-S cluster assembly protein SufD [Methylococcaceae bacterium]
MASAVSSLKKYVEEYDEIKSTLPGQELDWLVQLRQQSLNQFSTRGFPTIRDEDWRYTNVTPLIKKSFQSVVAKPSTAVVPEQMDNYYA